MPPRRSWLRILAIVFAVLGAGEARADEPTAQYRVQGGRPHAEVPFHIDLVIEGFDDAPPPEQPPLEIAGATVTPLGVSPQTSRSIQIINGRRIDSVQVTWVLRYRVLTSKDGVLSVPSVEVTQGKLRARPAAGNLNVDSVPTTDDMKLALEVPDRPVFVGETVPIKVRWLFRSDPEDQTFSVPLLGLDTFAISTPPVAAGNRKVIELAAGTKDIQVPYEIDTVTVGGAEFRRLTMTLQATPRSIPPGGKLEVPGSAVIAALAVGRRDFFGQARTRLFRATDAPRTLEVKPLPETDRPATFAGAVGDQFSIEVRTSRSVVQLGEPVELAVTIKSDQRLESLALGKLDGEGRLPKDRFTVPSEAPTGVLSDDGKTKTFKVDVQVTGPTSEIPSLAFSYFDPVKAAYRTIRSEPIAVSVKGGGTIVGADDVVAARPTSRGSGAAQLDDTASVKAELSLSTLGQVDQRPLGGAALWILVGLLYIVPLGVLGFRSWQLRTATQREEAGEVRAARRRVEELLDRGDQGAARELAGPLAAALRELARVLGRPSDDQGLIARLETESFAPSAADKPLSADLRSDAAGLLRKWMNDARKRPARKAAS
ncbi:MAG: BatD family protein [Deltaproteobacteria bacterium]|nr:BatD family protein [Deltaproteobacteria bacterium]MCW5801219.1 BatD family protein [Deltaproteobacteria bacterium]